VGNILCTSAISGKDPASGVLPADVQAQAGHVFANLKAVLAAGGATLDDVVKFSVTLNDDSVREAFNAQWNAAFPDPRDRPARHIVVSALQHGMHVQIEVIAVIQASS